MKKLLVSILHYISTSLFILCLLVLFYNFGFELFSNSSQIGNFVSSNHHSIGYSYPVNIKNSIPDSVITYSSQNSKGSIRYYRNTNHTSDSLFKNDSLKDRIINDIVVYPKLEENSYQITEELKSSFPIRYTSNYLLSEGYVRLNTDIFWIKLLLAFRAYLGIILMPSIFYILMSIFKKLKTDLNFNRTLSRKTRIIGLLLLGYQFLNTISIITLSRYINVIRIDTFLNQEFLERGLYLNITPRLNFNITILILGLSLIIISTLFKHGDKIKQENDLTI